ncbi:MAG: PD40 domain-containing protein [Pirellulales bacterium]|nr:PD40 domain-containing protein [Pirellulales bacterium]
MMRMDRLWLCMWLTIGCGCLLASDAPAAETVSAEAERPSRVVFDFETGDVQGWRVVEGEFGKLVGSQEFFYNRPSVRYNKQGEYYLTTLERTGPRTDEMTGVMESPVFVLDGPAVSFLVGGGNHRDTYVALCTKDGKEVFQARGQNTETLFRATWDAEDLLGRRVFLRVVDQNTGGWGHVSFDDFSASGRIDEEATKARFASLEQLRRQRMRQGLLAASQSAEASLRAAVEDLVASFGNRYPKGREYLARLDRLQEQIARASGRQADTLRQELCALAREALLANPLVSGQPILFVVRRQYRSDHHNTATMFQTGEINTGSFTGGGAVKLIDFRRDGAVKTLLALPEGVARDPDVGYDGRRVLFSMRRDPSDDYHLYEMEADGNGLKQLTFGSGISDIDPIYLPDGRILFASTREPKFCMCNRHIMCNLFTMDADGANVQQIGHSTLHEGHPAVMPDGRIIYDRWEYVDRNFGDAQGVWTCNPDGTNHVVYWGNNTNSPGGVLDNRVIPGTERLICNFSSCHDRPWGALAIVDRRLGIDGKTPVIRTWPVEAIDLVGQGNYDTFTRVSPKYEDPYPLSDKYFLCSRMIGQGEQMGLYLLDLFGNEILLHAEEPGCFDPMPLAPRGRPIAIPPRIDLARKEGYYYLSDVYEGTGMEAVERGTVKQLRVVESPEKRFWTQQNWQGSGTQAPGMAFDDFNNKRIVGTVPVEKDGSAYFAVPADTFVYFQLLDEQGMMIQSMRSGTIVRPGESAGCIGCHENRRISIPYHGQPLAMRRPPSQPRPWYGPARNFGYLVEVQPVFDKHCVSCHDYGRSAGQTLNLAGDLGLIFNTSYLELRTKRLVNVPGAGPFQTLPPKSWGSHASSLAEVLLEGHRNPEHDKEIRLDKEDFHRIVTWIDINAPYYPDYASAYRENRYGRSPLGDEQLKRLSELTGVNLGDQELSCHVSFTRPEVSLCLARFADKSDPAYREALAIIEAGRQMLVGRPRADMPDFRLVDQAEITQEAKYQTRLEVECEMRSAIASGGKKYEGP